MNREVGWSEISIPPRGLAMIALLERPGYWTAAGFVGVLGLQARHIDLMREDFPLELHWSLWAPVVIAGICVVLSLLSETLATTRTLVSGEQLKLRNPIWPCAVLIISTAILVPWYWEYEGLRSSRVIQSWEMGAVAAFNRSLFILVFGLNACLLAFYMHERAWSDS